MKKLLTLVLCIITSTTILFASGNNENQEASSKLDKQGLPEVTMLFPGIDATDTIDPITGIKQLGLQHFEELVNEEVPDINIHIVSIPWNGWIQKLEAMMISGEVDTGFYTNQVAVPDWFEDLTPYMENDPEFNFSNLDNIFARPAIDALPYKTFNYPEVAGNIYGIPLAQGNFNIVVNKKIFAQWGIDLPTETTTFPELVQMAQKMTGKNPVTGKHNYGAYLISDRMEWNAISYDAVKAYKSDDMDINNFDVDTYINYIKDSPEVLKYFQDMTTLVKCAPKGIATKTGNEAFITENDAVAINFDIMHANGIYLNDLYGDFEETDNYKLIGIPTGIKNGMQGFPVFKRIGLNKKAHNKEAAWEAIKKVSSNPKILDFFMLNYNRGQLPVIKDSANFDILKYPINQERSEYQNKTAFDTDDYWFWRSPIQKVNNKVISQTISPEEARQEFYEESLTWVKNLKSQMNTK